MEGMAFREIRQQSLPGFEWQSRYYEHVIRGDRPLDRIRTYILENPRLASPSGNSVVVAPASTIPLPFCGAAIHRGFSRSEDSRTAHRNLAVLVTGDGGLQSSRDESRRHNFS